MKLAVIAKLRNGPLVRFREDMAMSQKQAAELCGLSQNTWCAVECMQFGRVSWNTICTIANLIDVPTDDICPEPLRRVNFTYTRTTQYRDIDAQRLLEKAQSDSRRLILPDPSSEADRALLHDRVQAILQTLIYREREIVKLRYGLGEDGFSHTREDVAKIFKVSRERVRQVEAKAIRKLQHPVRARKLAEFAQVDMPKEK